MVNMHRCCAVVLTSCALFAACHSGTTPQPSAGSSDGVSTGPIVTASSAPSLAEISVGESLSLSLTAIDAQGNPTSAPTLTSSAPGVATFGGSSVSGVSPGTALIQYATAAGPITVATIVVVPSGTPIDQTTPASIAVARPVMSLSLGGTGQIGAQAYSVAGTQVAAALTHTSAQTGVATVNANGVVTGATPGFTTVSIALTVPSAGSDASADSDADADSGAGADSEAGAPTTLTVAVVVEVKTSGGQEPVPNGHCGAQPIPVQCSFLSGEYAALVGVTAQLDPVQVTYACPLSQGFSTAGQWTDSVAGGSNAPISSRGLLGPVESCGFYGINFALTGATTYACTAATYVTAQPNWSGAWTCSNSDIRSGLMETGQLTGVPRDGRTICPPQNDPNCCAFGSTNEYSVSTSVSPATCTALPPQGGACRLGGRILAAPRRHSATPVVPSGTRVRRGASTAAAKAAQPRTAVEKATRACRMMAASSWPVV